MDVNSTGNRVKSTVYALTAVAAAQYMYDRLTEGSTETDSIGAVLEHVSKVYQEQDQNFVCSTRPISLM
jgi:hypothetical protein